MKKIKYVILLLIAFLIFSVELKAEEHEAAGEESQSSGHETGTPLIYYINWAGLVAMGVIASGEVRKNKKEKKHQKDEKGQDFYEAGSEKPNDPEHKLQKPVLKPILLILIACFIFYCEQLPVLTAFHENLAAGYFRFISKIIIGVLMLSYGLSSMEEEHH